MWKISYTLFSAVDSGFPVILSKIGLIVIIVSHVVSCHLWCIIEEPTVTWSCFVAVHCKERKVHWVQPCSCLTAGQLSVLTHFHNINLTPPCVTQWGGYGLWLIWVRMSIDVLTAGGNVLCCHDIQTLNRNRGVYSVTAAFERRGWTEWVTWRSFCKCSNCMFDVGYWTHTYCCWETNICDF